MGCANSSASDKQMNATASPTKAAAINMPSRRESQRIINKKANILSFCFSTECQGEDINASLTEEVNSVEIDLSHFLYITKSRAGKTLGLGGFGIVRRVTKQTGEDKGAEYAMKSMSKAAILKRSSGPTSVMTELRALIMLQECQYITQIRYAFQDPKYLYIVLDLAKGGDMRYNMRQAVHSRFTESAAKFYICQILVAVSYCHKYSILHRDVKPENILMVDDGYIKLSDFGVAKILPNIEDCRSTSGTHGYMAPELYVGDHIHGSPADWFATGITLHEFVTGRRPFEVSRLQAFRSIGSTTLAEYSSMNGSNDSDNDGSYTLDYLHRCDFITSHCKSFIQSLLCINPKLRLGSRDGFQEIIRHPWLAGFDWCGLIRRQLRPPCRPDTTFTRTDLTEEESRSAVAQLLSAPDICAEDQLLFKNYEYRNRVESTNVVLSPPPPEGHGLRQHPHCSIPGSSSNTCFLPSELRAIDASVSEETVRKTCKSRFTREEQKYDADQEDEKSDAEKEDDDEDEENKFMGGGRKLYFVTAHQDHTDFADCDSVVLSSEQGPSPSKSRDARPRRKDHGWFDERLPEEGTIGKRKLRRLEVSRGEVLEY